MVNTFFNVWEEWPALQWTDSALKYSVINILVSLFTNKPLRSHLRMSILTVLNVQYRPENVKMEKDDTHPLQYEKENLLHSQMTFT